MLKKKRRFLVSGFPILILFIILIAATGTYYLNKASYHINDTYQHSFAVQISAEQANTNLVKVHRAMKDVALSKTSEALEIALNDVVKNDKEFNDNINKVNNIQPNDILVAEVIQSYNDWAPIRAQTIQYAVSGEYDKAIINTQTKGAAQVELVENKMNILINHEKTETELNYKSLLNNTNYSMMILIFLSILSILSAIVISFYINKTYVKYEMQLYDEKESLNTTLHSIGDGVITIDINRNVHLLNDIAEQLTGWKSEDAIGKKFTEVFNITNAITGEKAKNPVEEVLHTNQICGLENHTVLTAKDGTLRHISDSAAPIKDKDGNTTGVVMVFRDVTDKKLDMDRIKFLSFHDSLTGLYNRAYFERELQRIDEDDLLPVSIIMGDVNGLKLLNDVYGHKSGDELLKNISLILQQNCTKNDIIARWGGDEFTIILPQTSNFEASVICNNIKADCDNSKLDTIILSISLGLSTKNDRSSDINNVLKDAEDRMYTHKLVEGKSARSTIISSLQKTLFERSSETESHASRMLALANEFGAEINLTRYETDEMQLFTLLHDIGKIGIADNVLNKPDKLSKDEWYEMKKHPEIGYRIAQSTSELSHIAELILAHHEHWDGNGYPQGLKGESIPRLSRILTIIDTYDVMTHHRPYKERVDEKEALDEIVRCSGTQFDPKFVEIFLKLRNEKQEEIIA